MKKLFLWALLLLQVILVAQPVIEHPSNEQEEIARELGVTLTESLQHKRYEELTPLFAERLAEKLPPEKIETLMESFYQQSGKVVQALHFQTKATAEANYYHQGVEFAKDKFDLVFTLNETNKLTSFRLAPYTPIYSWEPPKYADESTLQFQTIRIGEESPLTGELTIPLNGIGKTIVVMVHGSGPNDMDESLGPNKMFKDLAYGLGTKGITSIRYHKRSYDYPSATAKLINTFTFDEVVTNDAVAAIKEARKLGAEKVILLGHSLGGHMAPRIVDKTPVEGVIVMAGNSSPLHELLIPQYEHIMQNDPSSGITEFQLNMIKSQVKNLEDENYDKNTVGMALPLGLPGSCWLDLKDYEPAKVAKKQTQPYLILNGERDYQVTPKEAKNWKNGNKNEQSKTIIYPKLNHMFFAGKGVCIPSEYETEAHLEELVLNDIVDWITSL